MNILSLQKSKEVIAYITGFIRYSNGYIIIDQVIDIELIISLLIEDNVFKPQPGHGIKNIKFTDLFYIETIEITSNKLINKYLQSVYSN